MTSFHLNRDKLVGVPKLDHMNVDRETAS